MERYKHSLADRINKARQYLKEKVPYKLVFIITGLLATIWFLIRVIPKPARAGYPCMKAAAPLMSGFVLYLLTFSSSFFAFRKAKILLRQKSFAGAGLLVMAGVITGAAFFVVNHEKPVYASITVMNEPVDGSNNPTGEGQGIFPGRVIWAWEPEATNADCTNEPGNSFWDFQNNDTLLIRAMVENSVMELTGTNDLRSAWDSLFVFHNLRKNSEPRNYQVDETVFIKINQGTTRWVLTQEEKDNGFAWPESGGMSAIQPSWRQAHYAATETGPFVVLNILRQLVNEAGVPQENIAVGDPMSNIFDHNFRVWYDEFPDVKYIDKFTGNHNRTLIQEASEPSVEYSDKGEVLEETVEFLFEIMEEADYMINIACLKAHVHGGITLCAKNHFGSITRQGASHLHPSLIAPHSDQDPVNDGYGKYRVKVDIMGHKNLGGNTMLFIVEGLYGGGANEVHPPRKWNMEPFNGHWSSSVFMSLDQVALESVCYDFLRTEYNGTNQPENNPNWYGVDDYLHQAADPANWPDDFIYNPDGEGPLNGMGVHEHWNDHINKQYSRNLGNGNGIELIKLSGVTSTPFITADTQLKINIYPNPFRDQLNLVFEIHEPASVLFRLYDLQGKIVASSETRQLMTGTHDITWSPNTENLSPGIYIVSMTATTPAGSFRESKRVRLNP